MRKFHKPELYQMYPTTFHSHIPKTESGTITMNRNYESILAVIVTKI
jgi:hypothetical protein